MAPGDVPGSTHVISPLNGAGVERPIENCSLCAICFRGTLWSAAQNSG